MADLLERMLRRRAARYLPFTERPYSGPWPFVPARRDVLHIANPSLPLAAAYSLSGLSLPKRSILSQYEDRRRWHPEGANALPRSTVQFRTQFVERPKNFWGPDREYYSPKTGELIYTTGAMKNTSFKPWKVAFENPWKTIICLKRKMRREVIMAMGLAGRAQSKSPKWTQYSYVRCF